MKRLHINLTTADLNRSVEFYRELFDAEPTVHETDYAKWMLDDPRVNFSLSTHGTEPGIDHLGVEAGDPGEFEILRGRLHDSAHETRDQDDVMCCYANSTKTWVRDPNGVAWETFISHGASTVYGDGSTERAHGAASDTDVEPAEPGGDTACCDSASPVAGACCA